MSTPSVPAAVPPDAQSYMTQVISTIGKTSVAKLASSRGHVFTGIFGSQHYCNSPSADASSTLPDSSPNSSTVSVSAAAEARQGLTSEQKRLVMTAVAATALALSGLALIVIGVLMPPLLLIAVPLGAALIFAGISTPALSELVARRRAIQQVDKTALASGNQVCLSTALQSGFFGGIFNQIHAVASLFSSGAIAPPMPHETHEQPDSKKEMRQITSLTEVIEASEKKVEAGGNNSSQNTVRAYHTNAIFDLSTVGQQCWNAAGLEQKTEQVAKEIDAKQVRKQLKESTAPTLSTPPKASPEGSGGASAPATSFKVTPEDSAAAVAWAKEIERNWDPAPTNLAISAVALEKTAPAGEVEGSTPVAEVKSVIGRSGALGDQLLQGFFSIEELIKAAKSDQERASLRENIVERFSKEKNPTPKQQAAVIYALEQLKNQDSVNKAIARRKQVLYSQALAMLQMQVDQAGNALKSYAEFQFNLVTLLNPTKDEFDKDGWLHNEQKEIDDSRWVMEQLQGAALTFDDSVAFTEVVYEPPTESTGEAAATDVSTRTVQTPATIQTAATITLQSSNLAAHEMTLKTNYLNADISNMEKINDALPVVPKGDGRIKTSSRTLLNSFCTNAGVENDDKPIGHYNCKNVGRMVSALGKQCAQALNVSQPAGGTSATEPTRTYRCVHISCQSGKDRTGGVEAWAGWFVLDTFLDRMDRLTRSLFDGNGLAVLFAGRQEENLAALKLKPRAAYPDDLPAAIMQVLRSAVAFTVQNAHKFVVKPISKLLSHTSESTRVERS